MKIKQKSLFLRAIAGIMVMALMSSGFMPEKFQVSNIVSYAAAEVYEVDNPAAVTVGTWKPGSSRAGKIGDDYLSAPKTGNANASMVWTAELKEAGTYKVYASHPECKDTSITQNATYYVLNAEGASIGSKKIINQRKEAGWEEIGSYDLEAGKAQVKLTVENVEEGNVAIGDAIRFVWEEQGGQEEGVLIADNSDTKTKKQGEWKIGSTREGRYGENYETCYADASGNTYMKWSFDIPKSGYYKVSANRPDGDDSITSEARYAVEDADRRRKEFTVDQSLPEAGWDELGVFRFTSGDNQEVVQFLATFSDGKVGIADAVKLEYVSEFNPDILPEDRLIADNDSPDTVVTGEVSTGKKIGWQNLNSTFRKGYYGNDYASCENDPSGETSMTWFFQINKTGYYQVFVSHADGASSPDGVAQSVPYQVKDTRGGRTAYANHRRPAGWEAIGYFHFEENQEKQGLVTFCPTDMADAAMADAVMLEYVGTELIVEQGSYAINHELPRQTIWGLGIEVQSDSIVSGNSGIDDSDYTSAPHSLKQSERDRLYEDMLQGFRYLRLAGGLYYRGYDEERKHLQERWDTQNEELAELIEDSGIEGVDLEFWSPTPYFKASGEYVNPQDSYRKDMGGLKCFGANFTGDKTEFLTEFGNTIAEDISYLNSEGIPVVQFSIQNEPPLGPGIYYPACYYSEKDYYETAETVIPILKKAHPDLHIHANSWDGQLAGSSKMIIANKTLLQLVDAWSLHRIGENSNDPLKNRVRYTSGKGRDDLPVYTTEYEYLDRTTSDWKCINTAQNLMNWMTFTDAPTWHWLHMLKPIGNAEADGYSLGFFRAEGDDKDYNNKYNDVEQGEWIYNYRNFNSVRGFLKYMPWDSVRYDVTEDITREDQRIMAWKTPKGRQVIALTNRSGQDYQFNIDTGIEGQFSGFRYTPVDADEIVLEPLTAEGENMTISPILPNLTIEFWVEDGNTGFGEEVTGIDLPESAMDLSIGESRVLKAAVTPENAQPAIKWESSHPEVASVDSEGKVTGNAKGLSRIRAIVKNEDGYQYTDGCIVYVEEGSHRIIIQDSEVGTVISTPSDAAMAGDKVTVSVEDIPFDQQVKELAVTETVSGNKVSVDKVTDNVPKGTEQFEFIMPSSDVHVSFLLELSEKGKLAYLLDVVNAYIEGREEIFTPESMDALKEVIEAVEEILEDDNASDDLVKESYAALSQAQKNLEKVEIEEEYALYLFAEEASVLASPSDAAKAGEKIILDITDVPDGKEIDRVVVATSSDAARTVPVKEETEGIPDEVDARYSFKMPESDVFVFVTLREIDDKMLQELQKMIQIAEFHLQNSDEYTKESLEALDEALSYAYSLLEDGEYDESEIKGAYHALKEAVRDLVKEEPDKPSDGGSSSGGSSGRGPRPGSRSEEEPLSKNWIRAPKGWRYALEDGSYARDSWHKINDIWYWFNSDSYMETGWIYDALHKNWFYCDESGAMKTGWQYIEGKWYYLNPVSDGSQGRMFADTVTPDGYTVGSNGSWVQ